MERKLTHCSSNVILQVWSNVALRFRFDSAQLSLGSDLELRMLTRMCCGRGHRVGVCCRWDVRGRKDEERKQRAKKRGKENSTS
jgi:hypothetical protein